MLRSILDNVSLDAARTALDGLSRRQEAVASNVANIDTVGYKRRAVTFERALSDQLTLARGEQALRTTDPGHVASARTGGQNLNQLAPRDVIAGRNDDNQVSVDEEMAILADTQLRYQALAQTVSGRLGTLRNVIRGGR
jgi:flagellar basal-body rod protein FlgB